MALEHLTRGKSTLRPLRHAVNIKYTPDFKNSVGGGGEKKENISLIFFILITYGEANICYDGLNKIIEIHFTCLFLCVFILYVCIICDDC